GSPPTSGSARGCGSPSRRRRSACCQASDMPMAGTRSTPPRALLKASASALLFIVLGVLVVAPLLMVIWTAFIDRLPFAGEGAPHLTLDNFRAIWSPEVGPGTLNTLIVAAGGTAIAMVFGGLLA